MVVRTSRRLPGISFEFSRHRQLMCCRAWTWPSSLVLPSLARCTCRLLWRTRRISPPSLAMICHWPGISSAANRFMPISRLQYAPSFATVEGAAGSIRVARNARNSASFPFRAWLRHDGTQQQKAGIYALPLRRLARREAGQISSRLEQSCSARQQP